MWLDSLTQLVDERLGMRLSVGGREESLRQAVLVRAQANGLGSVEAYVRFLASKPERDEEFRSLVLLVTNGHTSFFRDPEQLDGLTTVLTQRGAQGPVHVWCAGCSTGEEPYTLAMIALELGVDARILASDINHQSLDTAKAGVYDAWTARRVPRPYAAYFLARGERLVVRPDVRRRVEFRQHNILHVPPRPDEHTSWDIIVCRNVFIYFTTLNMERVARRFAAVVAPEGHLFIGASERFAEGRDWRVEVLGRRAIYRPVGAGVPTPAAPTATYQVVVAPLPGNELAAPSALRSGDVGDDIAPAPAVDAVVPCLDLPSSDFDRLRVLLDSQNQAAARVLATRLCAEHPNELRIQLTSGALDLQSHDLERAVLSLERAVELDQFMPDAYHFLGVAHRKLGNLESARAAFQRALFLAPDFWPSAFMLAGIYGRLGMNEAKTRSLERSLAALGRQPQPFQAFVHPSFCPNSREVEVVLRMQTAHDT